MRLSWRTTDNWSVIAPTPPRFRQAVRQRSEKGAIERIKVVAYIALTAFVVCSAAGLT
jgi:hypothetical protein